MSFILALAMQTALQELAKGEPVVKGLERRVSICRAAAASQVNVDAYIRRRARLTQQSAVDQERLITECTFYLYGKIDAALDNARGALEK